ncbi:MAG TPA: gamma-glutamyl-gamma-aminobutyrate hydrolase family protein [Streptosporangiaceae bacterium]
MRTPQPLIGITAYDEQARWGAWDRQATLVPRNYVEQVAAAGGLPMVLPPVPGIEAAAGRLDALLLTGGPDLEPSRYGEPPGPHTTVVRPERDAAEIALLAAAMAAGIPVLGICRGLQVMNVALGGSLIQHLPDVVGHSGHDASVPGQMGEHKVSVEPSSRLAGLLSEYGQSETTFAVPTRHHQAIDRLADGLVASAWAEDGIIEAVEVGPGGPNCHPFAIGVQWHPEAGEDPAIFRALIGAASGAVAAERVF